MTIKQHGGVFGRNPSFNDVSVETLSIAGTALSSTAAELNILDGVTADATELNYLDGASTSAVVASKAVLADASGNIAFPDGKGIDFSATAGTGTSELFNDYEEGYFNPVFTASSGTITLNNFYNQLSYTKVGRVVTITGSVLFSGSTGTGYIEMSLPFSVMNANRSAAHFSGSILLSGGVSANISDFILFGSQNASTVRIYLGDGTSIQSDSVQEIQNNTGLRMSFSYFAA